MKNKIKGIKEKISKVWKNKMGDLRLRIEMRLGSPVSVIEKFNELNEDQKDYCSRLLPSIINNEKNSYEGISELTANGYINIIDSLTLETQNKILEIDPQIYSNLINEMSDMPDARFNLVKALKLPIILKIEEALLKNHYFHEIITDKWKKLDGIDENSKKEIFKRVLKYLPEKDIIETVQKEKYLIEDEEVFEKLMLNPKNDLKVVLENTEASIIEKSIQDIFIKNMEILRYNTSAKNDIKNLVIILNNLPSEVQDKKLKGLLQTSFYQKISSHPLEAIDFMGKLLKNLNEDVKEKNFSSKGDILEFTNEISTTDSLKGIITSNVISNLNEKTQEKVIKDEIEELNKEKGIQSYKEEEYVRNLLNGANHLILAKYSEDLFKIINGKEISSENDKEKVKMLFEKNEKLGQVLNWKFLDMALENGYSDEQLLRITNYPKIQDFILKYKDNNLMKNAIKYILDNDKNWILSLEQGVRDNEETYYSLIREMSKVENEEIDNELIQNFLSVISDDENYFNVRSVEDIRNYENRKKIICQNILNGNLERVPFNLMGYSNENKYKFALLEYKFGISLEHAKTILNRYGQDAEKILEKMPNRVEAKYLSSLQMIVNSENIEEIIRQLRENGGLERETTNSRNIEGQIINMFAGLYNETLYKTQEGDKVNYQEKYIDDQGQEYGVDVYNIKGDFNMNIRVEGAYSEFIEPDSFLEYYNRTNIDNHGNCESYIRNDSISSARFIRGVMVGYNVIRENNLTASGPTDLNSSNDQLSNYREKSEFRIPDEMINNTRHPHNEMVKDRLIIDENGNVVRNLPNYAVWIEESTEEERNQPSCKENRESDEKWIRTKKLAAQLGIPIVIIDREYFAKREIEKIELMKKMVKGEEIDEAKYGEYIDEFKKMSKPELIQKMFIKFENNTVGLQFNSKLRNKYFTISELDKMTEEIFEVIDKDETKEKRKMLDSMYEVMNKEIYQMEIPKKPKDLEELELQKQKMQKREFYKDTIRKIKEKIQINVNKKEDIPKENARLYNMINDIAHTDLYKGNKQHSIEHIQKVMIFSQILAEGEHLNENSKKLLLVAAALHDCGRRGLGEGNIPHAKPSAEKAGKILRDTNKFGEFTESQIRAIQIVIEYHEHNEKVKGKIDIPYLQKLAESYNFNSNSIKTINSLALFCGLLKDADALDRYRFAKRGTLNKDYLHSKTAKKTSVLNYAKKINDMVAKRILVKRYNYRETDVEEDPVEMLHNVREKSRIIEDDIPLNYNDIYQTPINLEDVEVEKESLKEASRKLISLYSKPDYGLTSESLNDETKKLIADIKRDKERTQETQEKETQGFDIGNND